LTARWQIYSRVRAPAGPSPISQRPLTGSQCMIVTSIILFIYFILFYFILFIYLFTSIRSKLHDLGICKRATLIRSVRLLGATLDSWPAPTCIGVQDVGILRGRRHSLAACCVSAYAVSSMHAAECRCRVLTRARRSCRLSPLLSTRASILVDFYVECVRCLHPLFGGMTLLPPSDVVQENAQGNDYERPAGLVRLQKRAGGRGTITSSGATPSSSLHTLINPAARDRSLGRFLGQRLRR
jgi:hypothetical protein